MDFASMKPDFFLPTFDNFKAGLFGPKFEVLMS